jgi:hypothetical protein
VASQTVLQVNIHFGAKHAPFIQTTVAKNRIRKFNRLPNVLGVIWGQVWKNAEKNVLIFEYLGI